MPLPDSAAPSWLYVPGLSGATGVIPIPEDEAHYVAHVCRARPGDRVTATDGAGTVAELELLMVGGRIEAQVRSSRYEARPCQAWVVSGAPEGTRGDWLVEKLAELGVARFQPVECERARWRGARIDRWGKLAVAALRQSRCAWLLDVREPDSLEASLEMIPRAAACWVGSQEAPAGARIDAGSPVSVVAIGPAPGFSDREVEALLERDFAPIRLAAGRLRTETAAIAWAACWANGARDPA